jgi:hypothetical protein
LGQVCIKAQGENVPKAASNQSNTSLFSHLLVFLFLFSCFAHLCCIEEKSNRFSLTRQGLTLFHASHQVFVRTTATCPCSCGGRVNPCPSINVHARPGPIGRLLSGQWAALFGLTRLHAIVRVIAFSLISNRNLACGDEASLYCCDMITISGDYDMPIITLDRLYFMLFCQFTPTDALSMLYG